MNDVDNTIWVIDTNSPESRLRSLDATAKLLPDEMLNNWLVGLVADEKYEEAAILKKEQEGRNL